MDKVAVIPSIMNEGYGACLIISSLAFFYNYRQLYTFKTCLHQYTVYRHVLNHKQYMLNLSGRCIFHPVAALLDTETAGIT